jgi:hypothetical protein
MAFSSLIVLIFVLRFANVRLAAPVRFSSLCILQFDHSQVVALFSSVYMHYYLFILLKLPQVATSSHKCNKSSETKSSREHRKSSTFSHNFRESSHERNYK